LIGRLRGEVILKQPPHLLLDVGGVGYEVEATMATFYDLPAIGSETTIYTHLVVREDAQLIYGFASVTERSLFRNLIKVSGVGPKLAMTILSGASVADFSRAIHDSDIASLTRLPGVGKKTAERLIIEMRDRLKDIDMGSGAADASLSGLVGGGVKASPVSDASSALIALGYKPQEASRMVRDLDVDGMSSEEIIRAALKAVSQ